MATSSARSARPSNAGRGKGLAPMNGMAGAGLACGIFGLVVAVGAGFWSVPFAVMGVLAGVFAVVFSARGKSIAAGFRKTSRISIAGLIIGGLAMVIGLLGVALR
jgi:hypothetical protein